MVCLVRLFGETGSNGIMLKQHKLIVCVDMIENGMEWYEGREERKEVGERMRMRMRMRK